MNYLQLLKYFTAYYSALLKQKRFIKKYLQPFFDETCNEIDLQLSQADRKKILIYYPAFTVLAGAENYLILRNRKLTYKERWQLTYVAAMASLCDDLIDEENWSATQLFNLLDNKLYNLPESKKSILILVLNTELNKKYALPKKYKQLLRNAIQSQANSIKQLNPNISYEEIIKISQKKNGNTSLMFASLIDEEWSKEESAVIYQSGFMGQLVNDTYDIFKDVNDGVQTFIQRHKTIDDAEEFFINEWKFLGELIDECSTNKNQNKKLINRFACMHAYALVAFDQFRKIEKGTTIDWKAATRKQLVIDMELWSTRIKLLKKIKQLSSIR
jgi:hypothetical protein